MKKLLCILITMSMVLSLAASAFAADAPAAPEGEAVEAAESADSEGDAAEAADAADAAESADSEGDAAETADAAESADSEGDAAEAAEGDGEDTAAEGESAEGESEDAEAVDGESAEGESDGESADGESEGFRLPSVEEMKTMTEEEKREAMGMEPWDPTPYTAIMLESPDNESKTDLQYSYAMDPDYSNVFAYAHGWDRLSIPRGVKCDFSEDGIEDAAEYIFQYSSTEDFADPVTVTGVTEKIYYLNNLKLGEQFYWRAGVDEASIAESPVHEMTVNTVPPRICYAEGGHNIRDIGGYDTYLVPGAKINQGLFYRGANLDDITEAGQEQFYDELGVRVEINMREEEEEVEGFLDNIAYYPLAIPEGNDAIRFEEFSSIYRSIFELIANADNEPIYLHCNSGADRTGLVVFILLNLLGVSYEDIARDYLYTNFTDHFERVLDDEFVLWWAKLDYFAGDTKAEQAKNWLLLKGVPEEQIEHIREIFIDGYVPQISEAPAEEASAEEAPAEEVPAEEAPAE